MATNFPTSLDALTNPTSSDSLSSPSHSSQHANVNDAVEALQAKVGADSSAVTSSHDYLIADHASRITTLEGRDLAGLVPLATSTFSSVASVTIDDVFSADYRNYKIMFRLESCSATMSTRFRLRSGGADITSDMHQQRLFGYSSTVGTSTNPAGTTEWWMGDSNPTYADRAKWELTLFDPYESKDAQALLLGGHENTATVLHVSSFFHNATTSCDGLKVFPSTGTFGGTVNVYGVVDPT